MVRSKENRFFAKILAAKHIRAFKRSVKFQNQKAQNSKVGFDPSTREIECSAKRSLAQNLSSKLKNLRSKFNGPALDTKKFKVAEVKIWPLRSTKN